MELHEAFTSQPLVVECEPRIVEHIVNIVGGAIKLRHPLGFTGSHLYVTLLDRMECEKADQGLAIISVGMGRDTSMFAKGTCARSFNALVPQPVSLPSPPVF